MESVLKLGLRYHVRSLHFTIRSLGSCKKRNILHLNIPLGVCVRACACVRVRVCVYRFNQLGRQNPVIPKSINLVIGRNQNKKKTTSRLNNHVAAKKTI